MDGIVHYVKIHLENEIKKLESMEELTFVESEKLEELRVERSAIEKRRS